jgi:hypothetical protein
MNFKKNGNFAIIKGFQIQLDCYLKFLVSGLRMIRYCNFHTTTSIHDLQQHFRRILPNFLFPPFIYELFPHFLGEISTNHSGCRGFHHTPIEIHHHCRILLHHFRALQKVSFLKWRCHLN